MKVTIGTIDEFERQARRLAKKYKSLKGDLKNFQQSLLENPFQGESLGGGGARFVWPSARRARARAAVPAC